MRRLPTAASICAALRARRTRRSAQAVARQRDIGLDVLRRRRDAARLVADRHGRRRGRLRGRQRAARMARPGRRRREDDGEDRRRPAAQAADADGARSAAAASRSAPTPFKITLPAPSNFVPTGFKPGVTDRIYKDRDALLARSRRHRPRRGAVAGRPGRHLHPARRAVLLALPRPAAPRGDAAVGRRSGRGVRSRRRRRQRGAWRAVARTGVTLAVHVCRGNSRSRWYTEGGYDAIAEKLFARLDVDRFLLEYDTERSGTFEPLRLVPRGKDVVLGLVTTKEPRARARGRSSPAHRRGRALRAARAPRPQPAVRLRVDRRRQPAVDDDQWRKLELGGSGGEKDVGEN